MAKQRFSFFFIVTLLLCASCQAPPMDPNDIDLSTNAPFGLSWEDTDQMVVDDGLCEHAVEPLASFFRGLEKKTAMDACMAEHKSTVYLDPEYLPEWFQDGTIGVGLNGGTLPVRYSYSYLHNLNHENPAQNLNQRTKHALKIRKALTRLYGRPTASGTFEEYSKFGFVITDQPNPSCDYWVIDAVGIMLCKERVIFLDGYEMSLSFTRLDRMDGSEDFLAMLAGNPVSDTSDAHDNFANYGHTESSISNTLRAASKLVALETLENCKKSDLRPIDDILANNAADDAGLAAILARYAGDELADYVFENSHTLGTASTQHDQDTAALLLLKVAADQGSPAGMNEMGASMLYCYLGVERDVDAATLWLNRAAEAGDARAMASLARIHLSGLSGLDRKEAIARSLALLNRCSDIDPEICSAELATLSELSNILGGAE